MIRPLPERKMQERVEEFPSGEEPVAPLPKEFAESN